MKIIVLLGLLHVLLGGVRAQHYYMQSIVLQTKYGCSGEYLRLPEGQFIPDLDEFAFDNRGLSAQLDRVWIFYNESNFNPTTSAVFYDHGYGSCVNLGDVTGLFSARFAGIPTDFKADSINFYDMEDFQGASELIEQDQATVNLGGSIACLITTGISSWTIFNQTDFTGYAVCLHIVPSVYAFLSFVPDYVLAN